MIDIDHLEQHNDRYGRQEWNEALRNAAVIIDRATDSGRNRVEFAA